jgi:hypothetical protein
MSKRTATKPAAKRRRKTKRSTSAASRPKKLNWDMRDMWDVEDMAVTPAWGDETFFDEMAEWWDSPDGSMWLDMLCDLEEVALKDVGLDARQRKFLWPDVGPLDLDQSARRLNQQYPQFPEDKTKEFLVYWIQQGYVPQGYSESQMEEPERLTEEWAADADPE